MPIQAYLQCQTYLFPMHSQKLQVDSTGALPPAKAGPPAEMLQTIQMAPPSPLRGSPPAQMQQPTRRGQRATVHEGLASGPSWYIYTGVYYHHCKTIYFLYRKDTLVFRSISKKTPSILLYDAFSNVKYLILYFPFTYYFSIRQMIL